MKALTSVIMAGLAMAYILVFAVAFWAGASESIIYIITAILCYVAALVIDRF